MENDRLPASESEPAVFAAANGKEIYIGNLTAVTPIKNFPERISDALDEHFPEIETWRWQPSVKQYDPANGWFIVLTPDNPI